MIDQKPRKLTQEQVELLGILARQVVTQIELRRTGIELRQAWEDSNNLLLRVLPQSIVERLKQGETQIVDSFEDVAILVAEINNRLCHRRCSATPSRCGKRHGGCGPEDADPSACISDDGVGPFFLRIGIACGPAVAGVIGTSLLGYDMWGPAINAARQWNLPLRREASRLHRMYLNGCAKDF